ncbi:MAG TPA: hypothetical protein PLQ64_02350 [Thiobacillaceae bacterium]|nr:hypothetical protein [Thiobacillaceae bacterium]HNA81280.1 hypothetical protein [Thiobacillaceae bacterium]
MSTSTGVSRPTTVGSTFTMPRAERDDVVNFVQSTRGGMVEC